MHSTAFKSGILRGWPFAARLAANGIYPP